MMERKLRNKTQLSSTNSLETLETISGRQLCSIENYAGREEPHIWEGGSYCAKPGGGGRKLGQPWCPWLGGLCLPHDMFYLMAPSIVEVVALAWNLDPPGVMLPGPASSKACEGRIGQHDMMSLRWVLPPGFKGCPMGPVGLGTPW